MLRAYTATKKERQSTPAGFQQVGAAGMPNFYPFPANTAPLVTELDPKQRRKLRPGTPRSEPSSRPLPSTLLSFYRLVRPPKLHRCRSLHCLFLYRPHISDREFPVTNAVTRALTLPFSDASAATFLPSLRHTLAEFDLDSIVTFLFLQHPRAQMLLPGCCRLAK